ncbi:Gfo/Idh/MocA family protein [Adhaeretor mobilis]|uniref:1,5-anhydro-D-fructose reductase n=1 Tax=Adhaeretor mobilis TaxID=1930276 RepID=A0A517MW48_9BACT|nr:Gfo/Idh/MocA family oxidoreductase [Adhaeretor mobilis]QDS99106.1 1,5-anhydro-D-fructose reductase [Adhaeretor mobilis]
MPTKMDRRCFLGATCSTALGAGAPWVLPSTVFGQSSPSNRINIGVIGLGTRGIPDMKVFMQNEDVQIRAICDVNKASGGYRDESTVMGLEPALRIANQYYAEKQKSGTYNGVFTTSDFRDILERDDIDAVALVVPDHWHATMTRMAAEAGKDVFCQKPLTLTLGEGQEMIKTVRKHGRVLQTASQYRSNCRARHACELVLNGRIGKLKSMRVRIGYNNKIGPGPGWEPMPVPNDFDYDMWLGPAPRAAYHEKRCLYKFRFNLDYSGGQITNLGAHAIDIAQWGNGSSLTGPVEVEGIGAKWLPDGSLFNTALESTFRARYANGVELICESSGEAMGVRFEGTEGWIEFVLVGGKFRASSKSLENEIIGLDEIHLPVSNLERTFDNPGNFYADHVRNFLDCVITREDPLEPVEVGHRTASVCHLWNIAIKNIGKKLNWDPDKEKFTNDDSANSMCTRPTHDWS